MVIMAWLIVLWQLSLKNSNFFASIKIGITFIGKND